MKLSIAFVLMIQLSASSAYAVDPVFRDCVEKRVRNGIQSILRTKPSWDHLKSRLGLRKGDDLEFISRSGNMYRGKYRGEDAEIVTILVNGEEIRLSKPKLDLARTRRIEDPDRQRVVSQIVRGELFNRGDGFMVIETESGEVKRLLPSRPEYRSLPDYRYGEWVELKSKNGNVRQGVFVMETDDSIVIRMDGKAHEYAKENLRALKKNASAAVENPRDIREIFKSQDSIRLDSGSLNRRQYLMPNGRSLTLDLVNELENRALGSIREFSVGEANRLEPGAYTFVILRNGRVVFGKAENIWEVGTKHLQLANGREAVSAGEIRIDPDGRFSWNESSGSIAMQIADTTGEINLRRRTDEALELLLGKRGQYAGARSNLLPTRQPTVQEVRRYCTDRRFFYHNVDACCRIVGICR